MNIKAILCFLLIFPAFSVGEEKSYLTSQDLYKINEITDCQVSPDGRFIAYIVMNVDRENNSYISNIWLISVRGGKSKQLTTAKARDKNPVWSPDGKYLAFVSNRSGKNQIWLINVNGGEAWTLTSSTSGAFSPIWSPDARYIAFLSYVRTTAKSQEDSIPSGTANKKESVNDVKVINHLKYRSGTTYFDHKFSHIFIIPANGGQAKQITFGDFHDRSPAWSPDSRSIAFSSNRKGDIYFDDNEDIFIIDHSGENLRRVTDGPGPEQNPIWSPDGKKICYSARAKKNDGSLQNDLWITDPATGERDNLTKQFDRIIYRTQWSGDGRSIFFLAPDFGNIHLYSIHLNGIIIEKLVSGKRQLRYFHASVNNRIAYIATNNTNPSDLFLADLSTRKQKRLTFINHKFLKTVRLSEPEEFHYKSKDNLSIHGWILKPPNHTRRDKYPLIVEIHGGPRWYYGNSWMQEFQILAAQGYVLFYCNPRQSTGYGQDFVLRGKSQWGRGDYDDILSGLDHVLSFGYVDSTKLGVTGGSYGGFMTNWIIGHSNRFKAAVTQRSLSNLVSFYSTTDIQSFVEHDFGFPWENYSKLMTHSPITYAKNINTPLLIIHSEQDYRVPISQAEELFTILKRRNVSVEFVSYPNEGHDLSRSGQPVHRVDRYNRIVDWFNRYLKN